MYGSNNDNYKKKNVLWHEVTGRMETNCGFDSVIFVQLTLGRVVRNFSEGQIVPLNKCLRRFSVIIILAV